MRERHNGTAPGRAARRGGEGCRRCTHIGGGGRRRWLGLALALLLLLGACAPGETPDETPGETPRAPLPEALRLDEGALFAYYTIANRYNYMGGTNNYGLLNARGEFVLDQEYSWITEVYGFDIDGRVDPVELERGYFIAALYEEMSEALRAQVEQEGWADLNTFQALVSPDGAVLTGFDYEMIVLAQKGSPYPFIGMRPDKSFVWLDEAGGEHALDDVQTLRALRQAFRYRIVDYWEYLVRTGPDVPEEGFDDILELEDGRYWGGRSVWNEDGVDDYRYYMELYSAGGERISDRRYNSVVRVSDGLYLAFLYGYMNESGEDRVFLTDESGIPLDEEVYDEAWYYSIDPYLAVRRGTEMIVLDKETLREHMRFEVTLSDQGYRYSNVMNNRPCFTLSAEGEPPRIVFLDVPGEEIVLHNYPGMQIDACNGDFTRFVLAPSYSEKGSHYYLLVTDEGETLMQVETSLYPMAEGSNALTFTKDREDDWSYYRYGLCDWDGNELLPAEYTDMFALPGNALHVTRGDWTGVIDYAGNWIYRESIFQSME